MSTDCLFCKIIAGEIPANKVYSDEDVFAFHDINPQAPVHVLVVPTRHLARADAANEADEALLGRLILKANQIAADLGLGDEGYRYVINTGQHGGQTVLHLHLHILGGRALSWPPG